MSAARLLLPKALWLAPALPFVALSFRLHAVADNAGSAVGAELAALSAPLAPSPVPEEPESDLFADITLASSPLGADATSASSKKGGHGRARAARPTGVRVSAARVLALAEQRAMPRAVAVPANAIRPAGLALRGVNGLGIGVHDGDVLTQAAGVPALSAAAVIGAVLAARSHHEAEISGVIYRGGEPYTIVVEQPYQLTPAP